MKHIPLTQGKVALVDDADYAELAKHRWCVQGGGKYAARRVNGVVVFMHRVILNTPAGLWTDHINRNPLDNRRANLRVATPAQNCHNRTKTSGRSSQYIGVYYHKLSGKWQAQIRIAGHLRYIGMFDSEELAAKAYDAQAKEARGAYAKLNFDKP